MRILRSIAFAAGLAALVAAAPAARACDKHDAEAKAKAGHDCPHAAKAASKTADGHDCPHAAKAALKTANAGHDCPHAKAAGAGDLDCCKNKNKHKAAGQTASKTTADDELLPVRTASYRTGDAPAAHPECPMAARKAALTASAPAPARDAGFDGAGKVLCASCDLKKAEACKSMFRASDGGRLLTISDEGMSQQLLKLTKHGELEVTVHGRVVRGDDGDVLFVDGFSVGSI